MKLQPQQQQQKLVTWCERKSMTTINVSACMQCVANCVFAFAVKMASLRRISNFEHV